MFCTKCGAQLKDGAKFCGKCGAPVFAPVIQPQKAETVETPKTEAVKVDKKAQKAAAKEAKKAEKAAKKEAKKNGKKKHRGLKVLLVIFIILVVLVGAAGACWHFVIPQSTKEYVLLQKDLMDKNYDSAANRFYFSDKELADSQKEFGKYAKNYFKSGCDVADLFKGNYVLKTTRGNVGLSYDDKQKAFCGDPFTYSVSVMEPALAYGPVEASSDKYIEKVLKGFDEGDISYEFNAVLGSESNEKNNLEFEMSIKDGKLDEISKISVDDSSVKAEDYTRIKDGKVYITKLKVSQDYIDSAIDDYCSIINEFVPEIKAGTSTYSFSDKIQEWAVPDCYLQDYVQMLDYKSEFVSMRYTAELTCDKTQPVDVFDVDGDHIIIEADYTYHTALFGESWEDPHHCCILIRPYDDYNKIVFNADTYENMEYFNECLNDGMTYLEAYDELMCISNYTEDEGPFETDFNKYEMSDEIVEKYIKTLNDFVATKEGKNSTFMLVNIGIEYPLMICMMGDAHVDGTEGFIYDEEDDEIFDIGTFGEYGQFVYIPNEKIIYSTVSGPEFYYEDIIKMYGTIPTSLGRFEEDNNSFPTKYYYNGEEITQKEYTSKRNAIFNEYPFEYLEYVYYEDGYPTDKDTVERVFEECRK